MPRGNREVEMIEEFNMYVFTPLPPTTREESRVFEWVTFIWVAQNATEEMIPRFEKDFKVHAAQYNEAIKAKIRAIIGSAVKDRYSAVQKCVVRAFELCESRNEANSLRDYLVEILKDDSIKSQVEQLRTKVEESLDEKDRQTASDRARMAHDRFVAEQEQQQRDRSKIDPVRLGQDELFEGDGAVSGSGDNGEGRSETGRRGSVTRRRPVD